MLKASYYFTKGFLWGTATASHQVEGYNHNTWSAWENQPGRILNGDHSGAACDWWQGGRWKEDFDRAANGGQNTHRLSVEWSRIQPALDRWDEHALDVYRQMLRGLVERGLEPCVTLHHFSEPLWFAEMGGFENERSVALFEAYVRKAVEAFQEYVRFWVTINEPSIYAALGYHQGIWPPGKKDPRATFIVSRHLLKSHAAAYRTIHSIQKNARVGMAHHYRHVTPGHPWFPLDRLAANWFYNNVSTAFPNALVDGKLKLLSWQERLPEVIGTQDFLGLNYYSVDEISFSLLEAKNLFIKRDFPPGSEVSPTGMNANTPSGMFASLRWAHSFHLPIYITENGIEDRQDTLRPRYLLQHLHQVWRAVTSSWNIQGYYHWSLVDNFEWAFGWQHRFGLYELDTQTQARRKRPSADLYAAICKENGITSEMVSRYAPEIYEKLYPG